MVHTAIPRLTTPGRMAVLLNVPLHRVNYVLGTRKHILPAARAGTLRLYDKQAVALVRHELTAIEARRSSGGGPAVSNSVNGALKG